MFGPAIKSDSAPMATATPVTARPRFPAWLVAALLALGTIALYWPAMRSGFITLDDPVYVTANYHVQNGLSGEGVKWAFGNTERGAAWMPLIWLSHMLACQFFGLNPWGHHLINVLLHAANTALVFLVFRRLTGATWRSLILAALFGWHPLRVESVAWVAERKDVLSAFFWMLTLLAYAKYVVATQARDSKSKVWHGAAFAMFVCGLMSKPMLVTLPCVLLLLDYWPLDRFKPGCAWQLVKEKIPFFVLAAVASVATFVVQNHAGAVITVESLPLDARVENALISCCRYLGKMFWPGGLAVYYPLPGHWPLVNVAQAGLFLCGISALVFLDRRRHPFLLTGWLWFVGTLVPVIGLVQVGEQSMADRYTYVPSLGVLILTIWGAYELIRRWRYHEIALSVACSAAVILCLALTRQQLGYWQDSETLFRHTLEVTENNDIARISLGCVLLDQGHAGEAQKQFQEAVRIEPDYDLGHIDLGCALLDQGHADEALNQFQEAIRLKPDDPLAYNGLGNVFDKQGRTDEAISQYQKAIRLEPDYAEARNNLGIALGKKGQSDEAISQFQEAIRFKPDYAAACINLGIALFKKGQTSEAIGQYQKAIRLKPDDADAHYNLGNALVKIGQTSEAVSQYQEAVRLKPDDVDIRINFGVALFNHGQTGMAIIQFQEAIRLKPDDMPAHINLGYALLHEGRTDEAISQFQEAVRLMPDNATAQSILAQALELKNQSNVKTPGSVKP